MHCIHYASSLYGKLGDEMTGRFNQDLPKNLHTAFEKAVNFKPCIITKQSINKRRVHDINNIDVTQGLEEIEINKAHIWNPNYKGENYDPNYQQNKNNNNFNNNSSTGTSYQNNGNQGQGNQYTKNNHQEKPVNVSVTLNGPVSKEQLYKIQEVQSTLYQLCKVLETGFLVPALFGSRLHLLSEGCALVWGMFVRGCARRDLC